MTVSNDPGLGRGVLASVGILKCQRSAVRSPPHMSSTTGGNRRAHAGVSRPGRHPGNVATCARPWLWLFLPVLPERHLPERRNFSLKAPYV